MKLVRGKGLTKMMAENKEQSIVSQVETNEGIVGF